jgi:hypothetical protein
MPVHRRALSARSTLALAHRPTPHRASVILDIPAQHHSPPLERPLRYTATAQTFRRHPLRTPPPAQHSTGAHEATIRVAAPGLVLAVPVLSFRAQRLFRSLSTPSSPGAEKAEQRQQPSAVLLCTCSRARQSCIRAHPLSVIKNTEDHDPLLRSVIAHSALTLTAFRLHRHSTPHLLCGLRHPLPLFIATRLEQNKISATNTRNARRATHRRSRSVLNFRVCAGRLSSAAFLACTVVVGREESALPSHLHIRAPGLSL